MRFINLGPQKREWKQVVWLTILFILYTLHSTFLINLFLGHVKGLRNIQEVIPNYHFRAELLTAFLSSLFGGFFFSTLEIFYFSKRFKHYSYGKSILYKFIIYGIIVFGLSISTVIFYNTCQLWKSPFDHEVLKLSLDYLTSSGIFYTLILVIIPVLIMIFIVQINEKMGSGVLYQLITGKYRIPQEQTRIFMFLDIKSSTTIAEKIGHARFHNLLNRFFSDITSPIVKNKGEIYQYIGDEIVVTWTLSNGIDNSNCIQCFFDIIQVIREKANIYKQLFEIVPEFKAGMHFGKVMTGEIGIIKKEIIHSGDVINTTSRIQEMCNTLNSKFIVSRPLLDNLNLNRKYKLTNLGLLELRGREEKVELVAINQLLDNLK